MADRKNNPELMADLLGYQIGLVDQETRVRVERAFSAEDLAAAGDAIGKILAPLGFEAPVAAPSNLADKIMARVEAVHATLPMKRAPMRMTPETGRNTSARPPMRLRELVGLAAAIALFLGVFMPGYRSARLASQQALCSSNQWNIAKGYGAYASMFDDRMPYVAGPVPPAASWRPAGPGVPAAANSRHVFQLVRLRQVPANAFICPGRDGDRALNLRSLDDLVTFPDVRSNSYATNLVTKPLRTQDLEPNDPLLGDMNPLAEIPTSPVDARQLPPNSRSHGGSRGGQNVLYADFSVRFVRNPNVGIENDDIYRLIGVQEYTGRERPTLRSDAFLIP